MGDLLAQKRKKPTRMTFTWMCMRCLLNSLQALLKITTTIFPTTLIPLTNSIFVNYIFVSLLEQNFFTERYWIGATISIWKSQWIIHESNIQGFTCRPRARCSATCSMVAAGKACRPSSFLFSIRSLSDCSPPYSMARQLVPSLAVVKARKPEREQTTKGYQSSITSPLMIWILNDQLSWVLLLWSKDIIMSYF